MAITATATTLTRKVIIGRLYMNGAKSSVSSIVLQMAEELIRHADKADQSIIYCRKHSELATIYKQFQKVLGTNFPFPVEKPHLDQSEWLICTQKCTETALRKRF